MMEGLGFKPYDTYKDSRVDWIGSIPSTWDVQRAKWLFKRMDRPVRPEDDIVTCFRDGEVTLRNNRRTDGFTTALKEIGYQGIRKGDLVIHAMDAFAGAIGVSDSDGKSTPVYSACVPRLPNTVDPTFYAYYMRHLALSGFLVSLAKGIRERSTDFRFNDFAELEIPFPSLPEQRAIVAFLNEKCAKADGAVKIKEYQIALLRERRQIIIQDAVTRGLNPAAPMKDSGIDWIGQIPAHWEVKKASWYFAARKGGNAADLTKEYCGKFPGQFAVYSGQTENEGVLGRIENFEFDFQEQGCMLCSTVGANAMTIRFLKERFSLSQNCMIITPRDPAANMEFFSHAFAPIFSYFRNFIPDHMQASFRMEDFYQMKFLLPPVAEQIKILAKIRRTQAKLDGGIAIKHDQIAALKEYKTSLINAAVTGKIKVI